MRIISNEELVVVGGGDGYDFISDDDREALGVGGGGGYAPTNWATVNASSTEFLQSSTQPTPQVYSSPCGGAQLCPTGTKPFDMVVTQTSSTSNTGLSYSKNDGLKFNAGGTSGTCSITYKCTNAQ